MGHTLRFFKQFWKHLAIGSLVLKFLIVITILLLLNGCSIRPKACYADTCITLEIASTPYERQVGLMEHDSLAESAGMLFIFETPGIYPFWMKNMDFSIDMFWLDRDFAVVYITKEAPPCTSQPCPTYGPMQPSWYVLETAPGFADRFGVKQGDTFTIHGIE